VGHEQGESRPVLVVSNDSFNRSAAGLVVIVPLTRTNRGIPFHIAVSPPEGGLTSTSYILCDQPRTISKDRLGTRRGVVADKTMVLIGERIKLLLDID
jgi:mRNA interferase MazF